MASSMLLCCLVSRGLHWQGMAAVRSAESDSGTCAVGSSRKSTSTWQQPRWCYQSRQEHEASLGSLQKGLVTRCNCCALQNICGIVAGADVTVLKQKLCNYQPHTVCERCHVCNCLQVLAKDQGNCRSDLQDSKYMVPGWGLTHWIPGLDSALDLSM